MGALVVINDGDISRIIGNKSVQKAFPQLAKIHKDGQKKSGCCGGSRSTVSQVAIDRAKSFIINMPKANVDEFKRSLGYSLDTQLALYRRHMNRVDKVTL